MTVNDSTLGCCPHCEQGVPAGELFIDYTAPNGESAIFATCPSCRIIVEPE